MLLVLHGILFSAMVISAQETILKDLEILKPLLYNNYRYKDFINNILKRYSDFNGSLNERYLNDTLNKCYSNYGSCNYTTEEGRNISWEKGCMCDEDCAKYGDCCLDSKYFNRAEQRSAATSFTCTYYGIYLKKSCPPFWLDMETSALCQKSANHDSSEPSLITPVMNIRSKISYGNIFCAKCNFDARTSEDIEFIATAEMNCKAPYQDNLLEKNYTSNQQTYQRITYINDKEVYKVVPLENVNSEITRYNKTEGKWQLIYENTSYPCDLEFGISSNYQLRECYPLIKTCPSTWNNSDIRERCESYTFVIHGKFGDKHLYYKNIYCAICNNETNHITCPYMDTVPLVPMSGGDEDQTFKFYSFTIMFNTTSGANTKQKTGGCISNTLTKTCHPFSWGTSRQTVENS